MTLPAFAAECRRACSKAPATINRPPPARITLSGKPASCRCCCRSTGQTDRRTDTRPLHRLCSAHYAGSVNSYPAVTSWVYFNKFHNNVLLRLYSTQWKNRNNRKLRNTSLRCSSFVWKVKKYSNILIFVLSTMLKEIFYAKTETWKIK